MKLKNPPKIVFFFCFAAGPFIAEGANTLVPGASLSHGQFIQSNSGKYRLILQSDGNLVYYRTPDNFPRWNTKTNSGINAPMQGDGNFVLYDAAGRAIWDAGTPGNPGASVSAQDDGNLVIYSNGRPLWNIGPEPVHNDPKMPGDVLLRDMERQLPIVPQLLGHNGLWEGGGVLEVEPVGPGENAVRYNTLASFKTRATYRGAASPPVPNFNLRGCWDTSYCGKSSDEIISARLAIVKRARQIYGVGADYTYSAQSTRATAKRNGMPGQPNIQAVRGLYRCDTFILDAYSPDNGNLVDALGNSTNVTPASLGSAVEKWHYFTTASLRIGIVPTLIFNRLKEYTP